MCDKRRRRRGGAAGPAKKGRGEARKSLRHQLGLRVRYRFLSHDKAYMPTAKEETQTVDVSVTGTKLRVKLPETGWVAALKENKVILGLEIDLPGQKEPLKAHAIAAWVKHAGGRDYDLGVSFSEMTRADRERLQALILAESMK